MRLRRDGTANVYGVLGLIALVVWMSLIDSGCNFKYGSQAQRIEYDNRLGESVTISYRFTYPGKEEVWMHGSTVRPHSKLSEPVVVRGKGVQIRATTASGADAFDKYYRWEDFPPVEVFTIVIE